MSADRPRTGSGTPPRGTSPGNCSFGRPCEAAEEIQHALPPCPEGGILREDFEAADASDPLERAEQNIINVARTIFPAEPLEIAQCDARRLQQLAQLRDPPLSPCLQLLQLGIEALLARLAEVWLILGI